MQAIKQYGEMLIKLSEFVKELDETVRVEAFKFLLTHELGQIPEGHEQKDPADQRSSKTRELSALELIRKSGVSQFNEKAIVLAYWLEEFQDKQNFSSGDLKTAFEQAREQSPKNPSDVIAKLESAARIMKADKTGGIQRYRLTSTAINDVELWLNSDKSDNET